MNIAVIVPPIEDFYHTPHRHASLGAEVVCTIIRQHGHESILLDFPCMGSEATDIPGELGYLREVILPGEYGPTAFFTRRRRYGPSYEECAARIAALKPDLAALSCFAFAYSDSCLKLLRALRRLLPECPVIVGGAGPSSMPDTFIGDNLADAVLRGEAEVSLPPLLDAFLKAGSRKLLQSICREIPNGVTAPLGKPPGPPGLTASAGEIQTACAASAVTKRFQQFSASISRGCPMHCRFCSISFSHGRDFRLPPLESAATRILERTAAEGVPGLPISINIEDDNLLADFGYCSALLERLTQQLGAISVTAENGMDYRLLDHERIDRLTALGMRKFNLSAGIVPSQASLQQRRSQDLALLEDLCRHLHAQGTETVVYAIAGFPGDSRRQSISALQFLRSIPAYSGLSLFYPVPGLPGCAAAADHPSVLSAGSSLYPWGESLSTREMAALFRLSRFINLEKHKHLSHRDKRLLDLIRRDKVLHTYIKGRDEPFEVPDYAADSELVREFFSS